MKFNTHNKTIEYPFEALVPIESEEHYMGRITLNKIGEEKFDIELDLVFKESRKIAKHLLFTNGCGDFKDVLHWSHAQLASLILPDAK